MGRLELHLPRGLAECYDTMEKLVTSLFKIGDVVARAIKNLGVAPSPYILAKK